MTRRFMNRLSHLFKEKNHDTCTKVSQDPEETEAETDKENKPLKREKSLSRRASIWLDGKLQSKRKRKSQDETKVPLRVWAQQELPESYLSGKVEIPAIPISYSSFSMSQPLSSSSSSFSMNHFTWHIISSDQETLATTSTDRQDKVASQQFEPRNKLDLAEKVRSMLGDAISLADQELENE